ncbi:Inhibitor of growth protein 4 [Tetrabaena socialis]|uniref:PHD finger protein ING n=1 Tax=Tetrabaena socialis TaxID=47790 RepID=A0A2J8A7P9_9CHLO|nr:Inhibitor of growth protein 4 [Tetrabaena socialis]|eukprot:PNH08538.1 Inhibitor of growth protein 4 [Tetrabaena socialis]
MTDYLKEFIDRATDVPTQLRRRLALIRDLDEKAGSLHRELDEHCKKALAEKAQHPNKRQKLSAEDEAAPYDVESALKRLIGLADEKVNIANQIYDFMDKHINQVDSDLKQLDKEIEQDRKELGLESDETASEKLGIDVPKGAHPPNLGKASELRKKRKRKDEATGTAAGLPPIENEPAYCICNKPSSGQMVGCDNPDCTIEWFHFECVGLKGDPGGKWFCPTCRGEQKLGKKQGKKG